MNILRKKKIAFFLPSLAGGGAEKVFINLAIYFAKKNYEVCLVTICDDKDYDIDFKMYNINYFSLNQKKISFSFFKLFNFLLRNKFDVIFSTIMHLNIFIFFVNKLFFKNKIVLRESNNFKLNLKDKNYFAKKIYNYLINISYKNSILISPSKKLRIDLIEYYNLNPKNVFVINNPVSINFNKGLKVPDFDQFLKYIGIKKNKNIKFILNLGSLTKQKNQIQIIKSFLYLKDFKDLKLLIVGKGPLKKKLNEFILQNNLNETVYLIDFNIQIEPFLKYASLYVCSSLWEGFPNSLIDAGFYNLPIISNNCDYGPSEILENGLYGFLSETNNPKKMAEIIKLGISQKIKIIPPEIIQNKYNINRIGKQYEEIVNV